MKKSIKFLFAAIAVLTVASCAKEQLETPQAGIRTIGVAFSEETTKTTLNEYSPVWASGDTLWLSNGTDVEKVGVPAEAVGAKYFTFQTSLEGSLYMVYPYAAAKSVTNGAVTVNVPAIQDGTFGSANICVGKVGAGNDVTLKNVTSVMKITVDSDLMPVQTVCLNAMGNAIAGTCDVTFDDENVKVASNGTGTGVSIEVNGLSGVYYASVIPGKYEAGFAMTAVSTDLSVETKTSTLAQKIELNDLVNMGSIGSSLKPLSGTGTEGDPYTINNLGEWLALTYYVNNGNDMAGQYVKVTADINGITQPVGIRVGDDQKPFSGNVDGGDHTLTVDIDGANCQAKDRIGLFGLTYGATIQNVKVAGKVTSKGSYIGGVAGVASNSTASQKTLFKNCINIADVSGATCIGGIVGWAGSSVTKTFSIENCSNSGKISSTGYYTGGIIGYVYASANTVSKTVSSCSNSGDIIGVRETGGICGYSYVVNFADCSNTGSVSSTAYAGNWFYYSSGKYYCNYYGGTGGISGWTQNSSVTTCTNSGNVKGVNKVGGICGSSYWTSVYRCQNDGTISGTNTTQALVGGITGWLLTRGDHYYNINNGTVTAPIYAGGIVGCAQSTNSTSTSAGLRLCYNENNGEVKASSSFAGGILGQSHPGGTTKQSGNVVLVNQYVIINGCTNKGSVTAPYYAGGIVAYHTQNITSAKTTIINCTNRGTVTGTRTSDSGEFAGGIIGGCASSSYGGPYIINCLNTGNVYYTVESHKAVCTGGIIGRMVAGQLANDVSAGKVTVVSGKPADGVDEKKGAFAGTMEKNSGWQPVIKFSYYLDGISTEMVGTSSALQPESSALKYSETGELESEATISGVTYATAVEALNAYVAANPKYTVGGTNNPVDVKLYTWAEGPTLVPVE